MKVQIQGCPFCGEEPQVERFFCEDCTKSDIVLIHCDSCKVEMKHYVGVGSQGDKDIEEIIDKKWNKNILASKLSPVYSKYLKESYYVSSDSDLVKMLNALDSVEIKSFSVEINDHTR